MKKLAARDFEDILQVGDSLSVIFHMLTEFFKCVIPVFEGLLPEPHNGKIMRLLFTCAHWHGLAKLRMHTDDTLKILDETTVHIGVEFRAFTNKTCPAFKTRELHRESEARKRRQMKRTQTREEPANASEPLVDVPGPSPAATSTTTQTRKEPANVNASQPLLDVPGSSLATTSTTTRSEENGRRRKMFNLRTYKYHSLGDYANTIRRFGTSDSFSTEPVSNRRKFFTIRFH
jgi:hypothetical protein